MSQSIRWKTSSSGTDFYCGDQYLGTAVAVDNCKDHFVPVSDGLIRWDRTSSEPTNHMTMRFTAAYEMQYQMIPAVMYDENKNETIIDRSKVRRIINNESDEGAENCYFKYCIDEKTGKPWRLAWWYMSVPGATYSEGEQYSTGMFLPPDHMDAAASLYPQENVTIHEILWPEQTGPRCPGDIFQGELIEPAGIPGKPYSGIVAPWRDGYEIPMEPRSNFAVMLVFAPVEQPRLAWHKMMEASWYIYNKIVPPKFSDQELWDLGITFAKSLYGSDPKGFEGFTFGMMWIDGAWRPRNLYRYELGWCGQSVSNATSMLVHAFQTGDKEAERMGFTCLDSWISRMLPNGLLPTHIEEQEYTHFGRRTIDACNLSHGVMQFLFAWKIANYFGKHKPEYYKAACNICDFAVSQMDDTGRIGKSWAEDDLTPLIKDGTSGSFLTLALCEAVKYTGRKDYLDAARKSYDYYYTEFVERGYSMGGALDIFSIDKESAMPLLSAGLLLYELTHDKSYITCAENAAWYLTTWQWCYTRKLRKGSTLDQLLYNSFGGTSVSIHDPGNWRANYSSFFIKNVEVVSPPQHFFVPYLLNIIHSFHAKAITSLASNSAISKPLNDNFRFPSSILTARRGIPSSPVMIRNPGLN